MKSELNAFNMKIKKCFLTQYPSKKWGFVGSVPVELAFINPTEEKLKNLRFGEKFGPDKRSFLTREEAILFANNLSIPIEI